MNWLRRFALSALALCSLSINPPARAQLPEVTFDGGVKHSEQFPEGPSSYIADNDGITYLHYEAVSQSSAVRPGLQDGDEVRWNWVKPGRVHSIGLIWDGPRNCWQEVGYPEENCWDLPLLRITVYTSIDQVGDWRLDVLANNQLIHSESFQVVGYQLNALGAAARSGDADTTLPEPLEVQVLEHDGATPVAGEQVRFVIEGDGGGSGLSASYTDPPSGSAGTFLLATTDGEGIARAWVELGGESATFTVRATSLNAPDQEARFDVEAIATEPVDPTVAGLDPEKNLGRVRADQCVGNPINVVSGNKYQVETDLVGASPVPLEFRRYYNSRDEAAGVLGTAWRHHYLRSISVLKEGKGKQATTYALLSRQDGRRLRFTQAGNRWRGDADLHWSLVKLKKGWELRLDDDSLEQYDRNGRLLAITDRRGNTRQLQYEGGVLSGVSSDSGEALSFSYSTDGRLFSWEYRAHPAAPPRRWLAGYIDRSDTQGRVHHLLATVTAPDGSRRQYFYQHPDQVAALTGLTDENGRRRNNWDYDSNGYAIRSSHGNGSGMRSIEYGAGGSRTVSDGDGNRTTLQALAQLGQGLVSRSEGPLCATGAGSLRQALHDPASNDLLLEVRDGVGTEFGNYDGRGNPGYRIAAAGTAAARRTDYFYDSRFRHAVSEIRESSVFPGGQRVTRLERDDRGNLVQLSESGFTPAGGPAERVRSYSWDGPFGQLSAADGPRSDVDDRRLLEYYPVDPALRANSGMLRRVTGPGGIVERDEIQYNDLRRVASERRPDGEVLSYNWDLDRDRLLAVTHRARGEELEYRWTYAPAGEVLSQSTPGAGTLHFEYDSAARLVAVRDEAGNRIDYQLDSEGNVTEETTTDSAGELVSRIERSFDAYRHLDRISSANALRDYDHHPDGRLAREVDGNGVETHYSYDALRRRVAQFADAEGGDPATANATALYDLGTARDEPVAVTTPNGARTEFRYDDLGNLLEEQSPDRGTLQHEYDPSGNPLTSLDANGHFARRTFDARDRLLSIDLPGETYDSRYDYDYCTNGSGRLCRLQRGTVTLDFSYDGFGQVSAVTQSVGSVSSTLRLDYDGGRLVSLVHPNGAEVEYRYNTNGEVTAIILADTGRVATSAIRHAPFGPVQALSFGNGLQRSLQFDQAYRVSTIDDPAYTAQLTYDGADNITGLAEAATERQLSYDALNRLTNVAGPAGGYRYGYDLNGNRTWAEENGLMSDYGYEPGGNRLNTIDGISVSLDPAGNTLAGGAFDFAYSPDNRLTEVGGLASYRYNGLGQRVAKITSGEGRYFYYGPDGALLGELDGSGELERLYIYLDGEPVALVDYRERLDGELYFIHNDHLGTPRAVSDGQGRVVWRATHAPFGAATVDEDPDGDQWAMTLNLRFPGQYFDSETGLHYNYFRDYDPGLGRYIQSDPIGLDGGLNTFDYAAGNPMRHFDRLGLLTFTITGNVHIPAWVSRTLKQLGLGEVPVNGIQIGTAESFPFFDGAERDSGILVGAHVPGIDFGLGETSVSFGFSRGSVCDIPTNSGVDYSLTIPGLDIGLTFDNDRISGVNIGPGLGLNVGVLGRYTGVYSEKHGMIRPE